MLPILSVKDSNQYIIDLLEKNAPFLISRLGDAISTASVLYDSARSIPNYVINKMQQCDGIYCNNINDIYSYCQIYNRSLGTSNALASFPELYTDRALYYYRKHGMTILHNRCLEPFYSILENGTPWTHHLIDKKVLIVSPFIESFRKQLNNNFQMINNKHIFLPNQEFFFIKRIILWLIIEFIVVGMKHII